MLTFTAPDVTTCFTVKTQSTQRDVPRLALEPFRPESISVRGGDERVEVGEERVEVVTPVDADRDE